MKYVKCIDGVVTQVQPYFEEGFVQAPNDVVAGMLYEDGKFSCPSPSPLSTLEQIQDLERKQTPRILREAALGNAYALDLLTEIEEDIKNLRELL